MSIKQSDEKGILNTSVNKQVLSEFREKCQAINTPMNSVVEIFMRQFNNDAFELRFGKRNGKEATINSIDLKED